MEKTKSPLQLVADEIEKTRMKKIISQRFKKVEDVVYERIKKEMHSDKFNEILGKVLEKHGIKETLSILTESIEEVASTSIIKLISKKQKII
jgi:hypothetical protein